MIPRGLTETEREYFEHGVRQVVAAMGMTSHWMLHFERTEFGISAVLGLRQSGRKGQCHGIAVKKGRRCRLDALPGTYYCAHHRLEE